MLADFSDGPIAGSAAEDFSLLKLALRSKSAGLSAAATLRYLDQHVAQLSTNGLFITALYLIFDQSKRLLHYASAGHLPFLLHRPLDSKTFLLTASGAPFGQEMNGAASGASFGGINKIKGESIALRQGDLIVVYSSGLLKQRNRNGECFGRQRLIEFFNKCSELNPTPLLVELQRRLDAFVEGQPQTHDVAVIAMKNTLRDLEKPPAETLEHAIGGRFLCMEEEQVILEAIREHPDAPLMQIASDVAARDLRHLGKDRVQAYLAQTSHWLVPAPAVNGHAGANGTHNHHKGNGAAAARSSLTPKTMNAFKQVQLNLLEAFPIRQVLYRKYESHGQTSEVKRAVEFYNNGDYQTALIEFSRIRNSLKHSAGVYCFFGNLYLLLNMVDKAKLEYHKALKLDPRASHAHLALSYIALLQEDFYTAIDELSTALRLDKNLEANNPFLQQLIAAVEKRENRSEWLV
jgi:tetratricopeptide (TPR) repeat protein